MNGLKTRIIDFVKTIPASNKKVWTTSIIAGALLVLIVLTSLFSAGIRMFDVKTPSMGTVAPVGTMVIVQPQKSYAIGDVISFERSDRSYTHRIVAQTAQGWSTKGDLNGSPDPLPVKNAQITGKVVFIGKYLGFLIDALPWILLGCVLVYAVTLLPRVRPSWRWQMRLVGWSLVTSIVALWQRPWVNMVMLGYVPDDNVGVDMHLVNTGVFPVRILGRVLQSGQDAVVNQNSTPTTLPWLFTRTIVVHRCQNAERRPAGPDRYSPSRALVVRLGLLTATGTPDRPHLPNGNDRRAVRNRYVSQERNGTTAQRPPARAHRARATPRGL
jgi:signal peptidase I